MSSEKSLYCSKYSSKSMDKTCGVPRRYRNYFKIFIFRRATPSHSTFTDLFWTERISLIHQFLYAEFNFVFLSLLYKSAKTKTLIAFFSKLREIFDLSMYLPGTTHICLLKCQFVLLPEFRYISQC